MPPLVPLRSPCRLPGGPGCRRFRGWIEGGGTAPSSQAKDRMGSASDESCPARPCVRAERETYTVGLLASPLSPGDTGRESTMQILRRQPAWRAR